ncbi:apolipoprotein N-acyltransferase [Burkholderia ubonensis]|uniref:apolipoprotein N-acyltransferase n=1 Tax=Burkholderia ubonensis TaxID=101571 RepID=UPI000756F23B|nr:apolipoprotein N-acyltransferase [Burkholderia ubonensis]KVD36689.1 apolipoprotein N-acyltransferase [Burkholderia ubonensis]KVP80609.1 apolipoprotein N-acyltransferase [Burkholderia ubonensis]KVQ94496.1 apolipoprotein N-acyltransferase [Burkholderia ubonensis]KVR57724.1 apolipoprotein N-acyltransferase [Burkholderia ubonensis]KVT35946.1 apolipoprotein N-acyltransferase [Burkholderia ubonensis]
MDDPIPSRPAGGLLAPAPGRTLPRWHYPAALLAGAANTLTFAPTPHGGWLQLVVFVWFFAQLTRTASWKSAALTGGAFGFGNFISGIWWLFISMHVYGEMAAPLAGAALLLFSLFLSLYPAFSAGLWSFCAGHAWHRREPDPRPFSPTWHGAFAFASAWALGEWLRGTLFTGFPWLASGYPQVDGPFAGFAAIVGVYGIGWLLALFAALVVQALAAARRSPARQAGNGGDRRVRIAAPAGVALALVAAGVALSQATWTVPANAPLAVRLLQGNVKQDIKFEQAGIDAAIKMYTQMITDKPADLIVTPETAIAVMIQELPEPFARAVRTFSDSTGSAVLFGAVGASVTDDGRYVDYTNSLYGVTPNSRDIYHYDKHHLVPFGEFIPWGFRWFVDLMKMPLGDFARGAPVQKPFLVRNQPVMADICYEDIFGEEIAATIRDNPQPPGVLVNVTNLAWFGDTIALDQHLQIARMRALETGRPMLRATNTGMTAAIDARGRVLGQLKPFTIGSLDVRIEGTSGFTPYVRSGNAAVLAVSFVLLAFGFTFGPGLRRRNGEAARRDKEA